MATYKNVSPSYYDENFKAVFKFPKSSLSLSGVMLDETVNIETVGSHEKEKVVKVNFLKQSDKRTKPKCPIVNKCGGCTIQHVKYDEQLKMKTKLVQKLFDDNLGLNIKVLPTIGMNNPYNYRNKSQIVYKYQNGKMICGFYEEGTHNVVDFNDCYLQDLECNKIAATIKELMTKMRISAYDEDKRRGIIRHVLIKTSYTTKEVLVVLVVGTENFPGRSNFIKALTARHHTIASIVQNLNDRKTSAVLGEKETILFGKGFITDTLLGKKFKITSKSFYQINHEQTEVLYKNAIDLANIQNTDVVLDAYCGVGTIGILSAEKAKKVIGVELVKDAVDNAIYNAKLNNIKNISFFNQDATNFMVNMARKKEALDVLIMDPPRSGSTKEFLDATIKLRPKTIVYVSCYPHTLVVDLKTLVEFYNIKQVQTVDMFPHTSHVESIVYLTVK